MKRRLCFDGCAHYLRGMWWIIVILQIIIYANIAIMIVIFTTELQI